MKFIYSFLLFCIPLLAQGQNLLPNPDFEEFNSCPPGIDFLEATDWNIVLGATSDYFNVCNNTTASVPDNIFGFQDAFSGVGYVGVMTFLEGAGTPYREYIQAELLEPTVAGTCYTLEIVYSSAENTGNADGLGMLLTDGVPDFYLGQTPQLVKTTVSENQTQWFTISTNYIAQGNETHVTIGNFFDDDNTTYVEGFFGSAYYYLEDVSVAVSTESSPDVTVELGEDQTICSSEFPVTITSSNTELTNQWSTGETGNSIEVDGPGLYYVQVFEDCSSASDTIEIFLLEEPEIDIDNAVLCEGDSYDIFLDPALGMYDINGNAESGDVSLDEQGVYQVTLSTTCGFVTSIFTVEVLEEIVMPQLGDLELCADELPLLIDYSFLDDGTNDFLWQDGSTDPAFIVTAEGNYTLVVSNNCFNDAITFEVSLSDPLPAVIDFVDTIYCNAPILIDIGIDGIDYVWQDGSQNSFYVVEEPGAYSVSLSNFCGTEVFTFDIVGEPERFIELGPDVSLCPGDSVFVFSVDSSVVEWSTGITAAGIWIKEEGKYIASIEGNCSSAFDTIELIFDGNVPILNLPDSILLCAGDSIVVSASDDPAGVNFEWNDGSVTSELDIISEGIYVVNGSNNCGLSVDSVIVIQGEAFVEPELEASYEICEGDTLSVSIVAQGSTVNWSTGAQDTSISILEEGTYFVSVANSCKTASDSFEVTYSQELSSFDLGDNVGLCSGDSLVLSGPVADGTYEWSNGVEDIQLTVNQPGVYILLIEGECNSVADFIEVEDLGSSPNVDLGANVSLCSGDSIVLSIDPNEFDTFLWSTGSTEESIIVNAEGTYFIAASTSCGTSIDSIEVSINNAVPVIDLGEDQQLCVGDSVLLQAAGGIGNVTWNTGDVGAELSVDESGIYIATVNSTCGIATDSVIIGNLPETPQVSIQDSFKFCAGETLELSFDLPQDVSILWSTGSMEEDISIVSSGPYNVLVSGACGVNSDSFYVEFTPEIIESFLPQEITLCDEASFIIESGNIQSGVEVEWSTSETSTNIEVVESGVYWVELSNECFMMRDSIEVLFEQSPTGFDLGMNDTICRGESLVLDGFQAGEVEYEWQDGSASETFDVQDSGLYALEVQNECGRERDSIQILVLDSDAIDIPLQDEYESCGNTPLIIDLTDVLADQILWSDGSTDLIRELINPSAYSIQFINQCVDSLFNFTVAFNNCEETNVYIPNAFSPNLDGINDDFQIFLPEEWQIDLFNVGVYNRWGELIYSSEDPGFMWDGMVKGQSLGVGVYVYYVQLEITEEDGTSRELQMSGDITIVR